MNGFSTLPIDVKLEIFKHLDLEDISKFGQVSKDENQFMLHEKSMKLLKKKLKEKQQQQVREVEPIVSRILSYGITNLAYFVFFDYIEKNIVFTNIKHGADSPFEEFFNEDEETITKKQIDIARKYLNFILTGNISVHKWVNCPIIRHITKLVITNDSGVNDDSRSHQGYSIYQKSNEETIKRKAFCSNDSVVSTYDEEYNYDYDDIRTMDYKLYNKKWETTNKEGITWGDIMEGVMNVKGSKSDFWYELIGCASVKIVDKTFYINLDLDFGS